MKLLHKGLRTSDSRKHISVFRYGHVADVLDALRCNLEYSVVGLYVARNQLHCAFAAPLVCSGGGIVVGVDNKEVVAA